MLLELLLTHLRRLRSGVVLLLLLGLLLRHLRQLGCSVVVLLLLLLELLRSRRWTRFRRSAKNMAMPSFEKPCNNAIGRLWRHHAGPHTCRARRRANVSKQMRTYLHTNMLHTSRAAAGQS